MRYKSKIILVATPFVVIRKAPDKEFQWSPYDLILIAFGVAFVIALLWDESWGA